MFRLTDPRNFKKPARMITKSKEYLKIRKAFTIFKELSEKNNSRFPVVWDNIFFKYGDATATTEFDTHYIYHPAWAARIIQKIKPQKHVDISSTLHFCTMISAFIPTEFYDYRPAFLNLSGLTSKSGNLMSLPQADNSVMSLSCMHTVEHVGLGRYGEPLDPDGDLTAIKELKRITAQGGSLLFVVPIGKPKIMFNAHRIYSYEQIVSYFKDFELKEFSLVPDNALTKGMIFNATQEQSDVQNYGCGCFWFIKK